MPQSYQQVPRKKSTHRENWKKIRKNKIPDNFAETKAALLFTLTNLGTDCPASLTPPLCASQVVRISVNTIVLNFKQTSSRTSVKYPEDFCRSAKTITAARTVELIFGCTITPKHLYCLTLPVFGLL